MVVAMETILEKLKSRKFWFALIGALLPIIAQGFSQEIPLADAITLSVGVIVTYILGQGYVDGKAVEGTVPADREAADA